MYTIPVYFNATTSGSSKLVLPLSYTVEIKNPWENVFPHNRFDTFFTNALKHYRYLNRLIVTSFEPPTPMSVDPIVK